MLKLKLKSPRFDKEVTFHTVDNKPFQMLDVMWLKVSQEVLCCDL